MLAAVPLHIIAWFTPAVCCASPTCCDPKMATASEKMYPDAGCRMVKLVWSVGVKFYIDDFPSCVVLLVLCSLTWCSLLCE